MRHFIAFVVLVFMFGCVQDVQSVKSEKVVYHGEKRKNPMLGTRLGCSEHQIEYGFTKEECGELWDVELFIDWGTVQ